MKILCACLVCFLTLIEFRLWLGEGSVRTLNLVNEELVVQQDFNEKLKERNRLLEVEVVDLKTGTEAIEERARFELGMIEEGETFYLIVD